MAYRVFYHNLLITKLHHINHKKYTDGIHVSKDRLHESWLLENPIISMKGEDEATTLCYDRSHYHNVFSFSFLFSFSVTADTCTICVDYIVSDSW